MGYHGLTDDEVIAQLEALGEDGMLSDTGARALEKLRDGKQVPLFEAGRAVTR
jgi:hypothetical protein